MSDQAYLFEVPEAALGAFVGALVLGTLEAMRAGLWPLDAGIWTLGRPVFRGPLEQAHLADGLAAILSEADELSALAEANGRPAADARLDEMIRTVRADLAATSSVLWYATVTRRPSG